MSIQPLPRDVIAQIKSSIAITDLNSVICELLKNSLDANAARIEIVVDQNRGGCVIEDDGSGILPSEFEEKGGLGKLYHSSKLNKRWPVHGGRGTFLASLSGTSLLNVVSRHHAHCSHNMITMHKSEIVARQTPAPPKDYSRFLDHGTKITVRDLFGNMPVRVKQRSLLAEKQGPSNKTWDELRYNIVALLLAWSKDVAVTVRNAASNQKLSVRSLSNYRAIESDGVASVSRVCSILSQALFISVDEKASWVSVGACTSKLKISGAISLDPSPTKQIQFVSFEIQPLGRANGPSILYDEINRLFSNSAFGNDEEIDRIPQDEKLSQMKGNIYTIDPFTNKELRGVKKGVDRWPMFYINIMQNNWENRLPALNVDKTLGEENPELGKIMTLLQEMVLEFLNRHHFWPKDRRRQRPKRSKSPSLAKQGRIFDTLSNSSVASRLIKKPAETRTPTTSFDHFGMNVKLPSFQNSAPRPDSPFKKWSRGKSSHPKAAKSKTAVLDGYAIPRPASAPLTTASYSSITDRSSSLNPPASNPKHPLYGELDFLQRPFKDVEIPIRRFRVNESAFKETEQPPAQAEDIGDDFMTWINPVTKVVSVVNKRTGLTIPEKKGSTTAPRKLSLTSRSRSGGTASSTESSPWIRDIVKAWDNPVFFPTEALIPQICLKGRDATSEDMLHCRHHYCTQTDIDRAFQDLSAGLDGRISKTSLRNAQVISQIDKKFILIKVMTCDIVADKRVLVLVDQHAADERIRIESLLEDLCTPPSLEASSVPMESGILTTALDKPLSFEISSRDTQLLRDHRPHFVRWGIIYQITSHNHFTKVDIKAKPLQHLDVISLPPCILERCKLDPRLVVDLIRTEVYKVDLQPQANTHPPLPPNTPWIQRIHGCPQGIIEMLNSRACRSAIMFNDVLSHAQCQKLIRELSECVFPFQCAHGRPSLVPLVEIEGMGELLPGEDGGAFSRDMKRWKEKMSNE